MSTIFRATHAIPLGGSLTMIAVKVLITLFRGLPSIVLDRLPKILSVSFPFTFLHRRKPPKLM